MLSKAWVVILGRLSSPALALRVNLKFNSTLSNVSLLYFIKVGSGCKEIQPADITKIGKWIRIQLLVDTFWGLVEVVVVVVNLLVSILWPPVLILVNRNPALWLRQSSLRWLVRRRRRKKWR